MAARTITEIIRLTLKSDEMSDDDATGTFIPSAEGIFEAITRATITITNNTSGDVNVDIVLAYLAISVWYSMQKEGHMIMVEEDSIPAHVWWEQTAFRHMVAIGYAEYFTYSSGRGMYVVKERMPKTLDAMGVKDLSGGYGDVI